MNLSSIHPALFVVDGSQLPLAMLVVFGSCKILAEICERNGIPSIVGELVAGILIGPGVLNLIQPSEFLTELAELGVMFLLFRVGLEVKASQLLRVGGSATLVAVAGVVVPFALGWSVMLAWGSRHVEAIFVAASMVATSVGITAQTLSARGLLDKRSSRITLAAAVIDDVLGLLVLAVVTGSAKGRLNLLDIGLTAALAIGMVAVVTLWGSKAMLLLVPRLEKDLRLSEVEFHFAVILLFGLSLLSVHAGVAAIVGAFLAGMALGEAVGHRVHDLVHGATELLVPFFLAGIGLKMDLSAFGQPSTLILAAVILFLAVISKLAGCGLAAIRLGRREAYQIGAGMVPRGEVGMVVAQIGLSSGAMSQPVYAVVVLMSVATTMAGPFLLDHAYRGESRD